MAGVNLFLTVTIGWEEVDPDGSECFGCGDACYLFMSQAYYQVEGNKKEYVDAVLCRSCDEELKEPEDAGEKWKG